MTSFKLLFPGTIPETITVLLSVLHRWSNSSMFSATFPWSFSVFKSLVPQHITIVSGFCLIVGTTHVFMLSVFAPGKCRTTNLFSLSKISQPSASLIIESPMSSVNFFVLLPILWFPFRGWNLQLNLFLTCTSDIRILLRETVFSFESLASGISFNDSSPERQSNRLNVSIGSLFELFLILLIFRGRLGFLNSVSDFLRLCNWIIFIRNACDFPFK